MNFERLPIPVGTDTADPTAMMVLGGVAVAALLVAVSSPRLVALVAMAGGAIAGGLLIG